MKKITFLLAIALLLFVVVGCEKQTNDANTSESFEDFVNSFSISKEVDPTDPFDLPTELSYQNQTVDVSWESDDEDTISSQGVITLNDFESSVTLTATFKYNQSSITKSYIVVVKAASDIDILKKIADDFKITTVNDKIYGEFVYTYSLPEKIKYNDFRINCNWQSNNEEVISNKGVFKYPEAPTTVTLTCDFTYNEEVYTKTYEVETRPLDNSQFDIELNKIAIPTETDEDIELPTYIVVNSISFPITWTSSNTKALSNDAKISYVANDTLVILTAAITVNNVQINKDFDITVKPISGMAAINEVINQITVPTIISNNYTLLTSINGVSITWQSSDPTAITNAGVINKNNTTFKAVKLTATLNAGKSSQIIEFDTQVSYQSHMFLDRVFDGELTNTIIKNGKLVLDDGKLNGTYTTNIIETANFIECVGSYSATSSTTETCELLVRIRINNTWSKYYTYGTFGKGLQNGYSNQTDTYSKMVEDEIKVTSGSANAFQLQLKLSRKSATETGPIVSLLALAIDYSTHNYNVDITGIKQEVKYDVPKLYQHDVPTIGGSICSITSSTMLMMYKGYSFEGLATYPHQYMAGILKDYGHNIYGNWSYNCIGMGSFGAISYVKRFYSYNELIHHLCYVGPVAASIKGTFVTDAKTYTTNGHLIVVTGYKIEGSNIYFYINDPNISVVSTKCTLQALTNVNRMVSYIIE